MDHLFHFKPFSKHPRQYPLVYKKLIRYDKDNFYTFFNRTFNGEDIDVVRIIRDMDGHADFLQSWLFFGLLYEFSVIFDVPMFLGDFIGINEAGWRVITTERLRSYIWYWVASEAHNTVKAIQKARGMRCSAALQVTRAVLALILEREISSRHPVLVPITVLFETLHLTANFMFENVNVVNLPSLPQTLTHLLQNQGWCPGEITALCMRGLHVSSFYLLASRYKLDWKDHTKCSDTMCSAYQVNEKTYKTEHAYSWCSCKHHIQTGITFQIEKILDDGGIPAILVHYSGPRRDIKIQLEVFDSRDIPRYVAISHVWSDGMGNAIQNTLPCCRLKDLQFRVERLYPGETQPIPFWIDTLCVPRRLEQRKKAIQGLHRVYRNAEKVLVIDKSLQRLWFNNASQYETFLSIGICPWSSRLWTFQESWLAKSLWFDFAHQPVESLNLDEVWMLEESPMKLSASDLVLKHQEHSVYIELLKRGLGLKPTTFEYMDYDGFRSEYGKMLPNYPTPEDHRLADWLSWSNLIDPIWKDAEDAHGRLQPRASTGATRFDVLRGLPSRTTSRRDDEFICVATLMDIDPLPLLQVSSTERLKLLLKGIVDIPIDFIFAAVPRLVDVGYRWAPSSFLHFGLRHIYSKTTAKLGNEGLTLTLPGLQPCGLTRLPDRPSMTLKMKNQFVEVTIADIFTESGVQAKHNWSEYSLVSTSLIILLRRLEFAEFDIYDAALMLIQEQTDDRVLASYCCPLAIKTSQRTAPAPSGGVKTFPPSTMWCIT